MNQRDSGEVILSRSNSAVKRIRALGSRKGRDASGLFVAEGPRLALQALDAGYPVHSVVIAPELIRSETNIRLQELIEKQGVAQLRVSGDVYQTLSGRENPRGVCVVAQQAPSVPSDIHVAADSVWIALIRPQDPGNVGSIIRTADAMRAGPVFLIGDSADPYDPRSVRASMGSIFTTSVLRLSWTSFQQLCRSHGVTPVGGDPGGETGPEELSVVPPLSLVLGSEREGLTPDERATCRALLRIPTHGEADSLNLAVAAGILLYEIRRLHPSRQQS